MQDYTTAQKGILFSVITTAISGFSIFFNKYAVGVVTPPLLFTGLKNFGVGLLVVGMLVYGRKLNKLKTLSKQQLKTLISITLIGGTIPFYLFFTGLSMTSAINAAILQKTLILWVALFAGTLLKEKLTRAQIIGIALIFASNFIVGGFKGISFSQGEWMILASAVFWAFEYTLTKKILSTVDANIVAFFRMTLGSVILLIASAIYTQGAQVKLTGPAIFWVALSIVMLFGYLTYLFKALQHAGVVTVASILTGSTLITNILSAVVVTKVLSPQIAIQSLILVGGIAAVVYTKSLANKQVASN